jgi:hypothetical protein
VGGVDSNQAGSPIQNPQQVMELLTLDLGEVYNCVIGEAGLQSTYQLFAIREWRTHPKGSYSNKGTLDIFK